MAAGKILVLGATGTVGSEIVKNLVARGKQVRAVSRKAVARDHAGLESMALDIQRPDAPAKAFEGVDRAFLFAPPGYANAYTLLAPWIEEAKTRGLEKIVLMTAMGVDADENIPFRKAERLLENADLQYNIIRPNWFSQNFNSYWLEGIKQARKILVPAEKAKVSFIDARDIAACAAQLLAEGAHEGKAFVLTGAEALDHATVAEKLTEVVGNHIGYESVAPGPFRSMLLEAKLPADYADLLLNLFAAMRAGYAEPVTHDVETILGHAPITFSQYARDYRASWA